MKGMRDQDCCLCDYWNGERKHLLWKVFISLANSPVMFVLTLVFTLIHMLSMPFIYSVPLFFLVILFSAGFKCAAGMQSDSPLSHKLIILLTQDYSHKPTSDSEQPQNKSLMRGSSLVNWLHSKIDHTIQYSPHHICLQSFTHKIFNIKLRPDTKFMFIKSPPPLPLFFIH